MTTLAGRPAGVPKRHGPPPPPRNIYITFQGVGQSSGWRQSFQVVCGSNPPTPVGGYANWQDLARPLTDSLTIFQNYSPTSLQFSVIFGKFVDSGWHIDDNTGSDVEADIGKLEWMAGQGFEVGPSPIVYAFSYSNQGGESDLIPRQYRRRPWIINQGVQWGQAWRNANGFRVYQEATFTVQNYLNLSKPPPPDTHTAGGYFTSRPGRDTALRIAGAPTSDTPYVDVNRLAYQILGQTKNNPCKGTSISLRRKGITWPIRHGVSIWIPSHVIN